MSQQRKLSLISATVCYVYLFYKCIAIQVMHENIKNVSYKERALTYH